MKASCSTLSSILLISGIFFGGADFRKPSNFQAEDILLREAVSYRSEGINFQSLGQWEKARISYQKAIQICPQYAEAYNDLGVVLENLQDLTQAEGAYQQALRLKPNFPSVHTNLAYLYERLGKIDEAVTHWRARVALGPTDDLWVFRSKEKLSQYHKSIPVVPGVSGQEGRIGAGNRGNLVILRKEEKESPPSVKTEKLIPVVSKPSEDLELQEAKRRAQEIIEQAKRQKAVSMKTPVHEAVESSEKKMREMVVQKIAQEAKKPAPVVKSIEMPPTSIQRQTTSVQPSPSSVSIRRPAVSEIREQETLSQEADLINLRLMQEKQKAQNGMVNEIYHRGVSLMRLGRYEEAAANFKQAAALDPGNPVAQQALKRAQVALEKASRAVEETP